MMFLNSASASLLTSRLFANGDQAGISGWVWFIIFIVLVFLVTWLLLSASRHSGKELHSDHAAPATHAETVEQVEHAQVGEQVEPVAHLEPLEQAVPTVQVPVEAAPAPAELEPARSEPLPVVVPDDLTKIEGIGKKVNQILQEAGIHTFAQLAETSLEDLNKLLDAAKLQMMDPTTWPAQARLAAQGDWEAFEKLTRELKGGRKA